MPAVKKMQNYFRKIITRFVSEHKYILIRNAVKNIIYEVPSFLARETKVLLHMTRNQWKHAESQEVILAKLRLRAHALDKSLYVESWQSGRSKSAYKDCCDLIKRLQGSEVISDPTMIWAQNCVQEYEKAQDDKPARLLKYTCDCPDEKAREEILEFIRNRRSARSFYPRPIEGEVMCKLIEMVNWAPSSCCRQSVFLHITQNSELVSKCLDQCAGATCFGGNTPCFISVCGDLRFYNIKDRHLSFIDATFGIQSMLLAAHAYGIEGTVLNWMHRTGTQEKTLRKLLHIPDYHQIVFNLAMGYPVDVPPPPGRKGTGLTCAFH